MKPILTILLLCCLTARGQLAGFSFSPNPYPTNTTAGTPFFGGTVTATNPSGGTFTAFSSTVTWGGAATISNQSPAGIVSASFVNGVLSPFVVTAYTSGNNLTWTCFATTNPAYTGANTIVSNKAGSINGFTITGITSPQISGIAFTIPKMVAIDTWGNTNLTYNGNAVSMAITSGNATVNTPSGSFVNGVLLNQSVTVTSTGSGIQTNIVITVTGSGETGSSTAFTLEPTLLTIIGAPTSPAATLTIKATASGSPLTIVGK